MSDGQNEARDAPTGQAGDHAGADRPAHRLGPAQTAAGEVLHRLGEILPQQPSEDAQAAIDELIPDDRPELIEFMLRFSTLIVLSSSIAAFGLLADSGAVVIGAMLVAPLMTPIMAAAAATVTARNVRLVRSLLVIAFGTFLAIAVGWLVSFVAGGTFIDVRELPGEIRGRTNPGLLDLGIAITAGAAAGYIQPRRSAISALPGVGIAVALVPPLATVGITAELGLGAESRGAFLLYLTNLAAIVFAASLVLLASGFRPRDERGRRPLVTRITVTLVAVVIVAVPLVQHTRDALANTRLRSAVIKSVEAWDSDARVVEITSSIDGGTATIELLLVGVGDAEPAWKLAERIRNRFDGPVELRLLYQGDDVFAVSAR